MFTFSFLHPAPGHRRTVMVLSNAGSISMALTRGRISFAATAAVQHISGPTRRPSPHHRQLFCWRRHALASAAVSRAALLRFADTTASYLPRCAAGTRTSAPAPSAWFNTLGGCGGSAVAAGTAYTPHAPLPIIRGAGSALFGYALRYSHHTPARNSPPIGAALLPMHAYARALGGLHGLQRGGTYSLPPRATHPRNLKQ